MSGGVKVVSTVTGEPAGGPTFVRLHKGVTAAQFFKAAQGDPHHVAAIASIVFSPPAPTGTCGVPKLGHSWLSCGFACGSGRAAGRIAGL